MNNEFHVSVVFRDVLTSLLLKADLKHLLKNKEKTFKIGHIISGQGGHVNAVRAGDHGSLVLIMTFKIGHLISGQGGHVNAVRAFII